jgi:molecular chaperone DnaJ
MKDYYQILGISRSASKDDIKKAFRKIAHQYHPDKKGGDPEKFKEASEAYSVLSDEKKRAEYDSYGRVFGGGQGAGAGQGFGGFDFSGFQGFDEMDLGEMFSEFFGGGRVRNQRGNDISIDMQVSFVDSVFGTERTVVLHKTAPCRSCSGSGAKAGSAQASCETCNGKGKVRETRRSLIGNFTTVRGCTTCRGTGKVPTEKCETCRGSGVSHGPEEITVVVPPGVEDGEMIRLGGYGEAIPGGTPGDLYVKLHVEAHPFLRKEGANLVMDLKVKLTDALLGAEYTVTTLEGNVKVKIPENVRDNELLRLRGKGIPVERGKRGDLLLRVTIAFPSRLSKKARQAVEILKEEGV